MMCEVSSAYCLAYLADKNKINNLFDAMFMVRNYGDNFTNQAYNGSFHSYFFVRSKDGTWFAASPGNHTDNQNAPEHEYMIESEDKKSPLVRYFSSKNLDEVLAKVKKFDGGDWPTKQEIEQRVSSYLPERCWYFYQDNKNTKTGPAVKFHRIVKDSQNITDAIGGCPIDIRDSSHRAQEDKKTRTVTDYHYLDYDINTITELKKNTPLSGIFKKISSLWRG